MVKGNTKSSATSATRKKHAKKHTPVQDEAPKDQKNRPKTKAERAKAKKEPRLKMYIPPTKPAPVQPDPLETTGLAHKIPPDLLVVLRNLSKKAQVTKIRALEELQGNWIDKCVKERDSGDDSLEYAVLDMLPVWLHHVSALFVHPSRRVRALAAAIQLSLLQIPSVREQFLFFLSETGSASQIESIIGTWCLAAHDIDRGVAVVASKSWDGFILSVQPEGDIPHGKLVIDDTLRQGLTSFVQRAALDPVGLYLFFNPVQPIAETTQRSKKGPQGGKASAAPAVPRRDETDNARYKSDEQEESDTDRKARLRIAALNSTRSLLNSTTTLSEDLINFLSNPALWTSIYPNEAAPWIPSGELKAFGVGQPNVRKAAWNLVQRVIGLDKESLSDVVPTLASAILRSAFVELDTLVQGVMWQPLLLFLKQYPQCWTIEAFIDEDADDAAEDDEEASKPVAPTKLIGADAYSEFLQFLELGCSGAPTQGYPTVVIILSTIPQTIMIDSQDNASEEAALDTPFTRFFNSLWAAVDGRALNSLHRTAASAAFLSSLLECTLLLAKRLRGAEKDSSSSDAPAANILVQSQFSRVWEELSSKRLQVEERAAGRMLSKTLEDILASDPSLFDIAWETIVSGLNGSFATNPQLSSSILRTFYDKWRRDDQLKGKATDVTKSAFVFGTEQLKAGIQEKSADSLALLTHMLEQFREGLFFDEAISSELDNTVTQNATSILTVSPTFLVSYLSSRKDESSCSAIWHILLSDFAALSQSHQLANASQQISTLLTAASSGRLPAYLSPKEGELDETITALLEQVVAGNAGAAEESLVQSVLRSSSFFLSSERYQQLLQTVGTTFSILVKQDIQGERVPASTYSTTLQLIRATFNDILFNNRQSLQLQRDIFLLAFLIPLLHEWSSDDAAVIQARSIWSDWLAGTPVDARAETHLEIKTRLAGYLQDTNIRPTPENILDALGSAPTGLSFDLLTDIFPSASSLDAQLALLPQKPLDPTLALLEPLLPPTSPPRVAQTSTDNRGLSSYARTVYALGQALTNDLGLAKRHLWTLRHFIALSIYAEDLHNVPSAADRSGVFDGKVTPETLSDVIQKAKQISVYLFGSVFSDGSDERKKLLQEMLKSGVQKVSSANRVSWTGFLQDAVAFAVDEDGVRDARVLQRVLKAVLSEGVDVAEADLWIQLARKIEKIAPQTSLTITSAVVDTSAEPPRLDRYRNELAAALLGIKPANVNSEGLLTLRKLNAAAPDPESDIAFLPPIRAVNAVKACQGWVLAEVEDEDDEMSEDVESATLPIFGHLAPILQGVPGAHWEFVFDVLEGVLERAKSVKKKEVNDDQEEGGETEDLVALARALRLVSALEDLVQTNKSLRAEWEPRRTNILVMIRDLAVLGEDSSQAPSTPRSACRELVLSVVRNLPASLMDKDTLGKMVHLIDDPSHKVQKMAYQLLRTAAKIRTEYFVIEAGVDTEGTVNPSLPPELVDILVRETDIREDDLATENPNLFGLLLGWMLVFDLFNDASFKVKTGYIQQLQEANVVVGNLIPTFLQILGLDRGSLLKAFKLDPWAVDRFHVEFYQPGKPHTIPVLTAHIYYRALLAVPSLIHAWLLDCKDRQLSSTVMSYTSAHFSPVLIGAELENVREQTAIKGENALADENMSVKVAAAINEVVASYSVDEHQLEIRLRLPSDWPLHRVEVRDARPAGVDEKRWRAWVLGVQQTIWTHNGRLVDGLSLFRKNVALHFEGQVECAICYAIISVMDGSLPKKPCKTCKNRFHAGCLYKWFNTSHSSSCPLCRSDII